MFNRLIAWSLNNRLLVLALSLVAFVAGAYVLQRMQVDVFPEFAPPQVVIQTEAPGMAPLDVESQITHPIESAINGSSGVEAVRSHSAVGLSTVTIVFAAGSDIYADRQQMTERLQGVVGSLPPSANPPAMLPVTSAVGWLVKYALVSDSKTPEELRTLSDWEIRPRLLALGGIASVESIGGEVRQFQVRVDPLRLQAYRVTLDEVREALQRANSNVPGAFLAAPGQELIVNGVGRIASLDDVRHTVIVLRKGVPVTIANVADVGIGGEIKRGDAAYGMRPAVIGTVTKAYGADTLATTRRVEEALDSIRKSLPPGVTLHAKVFRQASFIEAAVRNLEIALLQGALIVIAVLFVFLMNWRASFVTFVSMPASFVGGLLAMHALGVGINSMTLGGLAIAIGEVVDNGIITVENVVHRLRANRALAQPRGGLAVVFDAVREIANSVIYATAIIVLIFVPIFFLQDLAGRIFAPLGIAYIASVGASLLVAVTLVPALCYLMLARSEDKRGDAATVLDPAANIAPLPPSHETTPETPLVRTLKSWLARVLKWSLPRFGWVTGLSALALAAALALIPFFGFSFLPEFKEGNFIIAMTTLPGTSLDESMRVGTVVRREMLKYPQVVSINQRAGRSELDEDAQTPNFSEFDVQLDFDRNPEMPADELLAHIRADLAKIPGVSFNVGQFIAHRMDEVQSGVRSQVAVKIYGEDLATLYQLGLRAQATVRAIPGAVDVNLEQQITVPQVTIRIDREKAVRYGIKVGDVADDIETALNGEAVTSVLEGSRRFDLTVRLKGSARETLTDLRDLPVDAPALGPGGAKVPLRLVAQVGLEDQPYAISRENVHRLVVLGFNVEDRSLSAVIADARAQLGRQLKLPAGYYVEYGGQFESQQQANRTLLGFGALALFGAVLLLFKAFGSLREALIVLFNLPLALIGGIVALFLAGASMSVAAVIGFITLFGIATRNGIILVSHYNQLRGEGRPLDEVVRQGTMDRLVPVLMTAATAALGLLPLLFGSPVGKELEVPLAQVVLGGLISATLLNLVVVPTAYFHFESAHERRRASAPALQESLP